MNEADEATSTQAGAERGEHPATTPREGVKAGAASVLPMPAFPLEADISPCPGDVGFGPSTEVAARLRQPCG